MSSTSTTLGLVAALVAVAGMTGQASAGPNCNTGGGARYSAPAKVYAAKPRQAIASAPVSKPDPRVAKATVAQGGGEARAQAPTVPKQPVASVPAAPPVVASAPSAPPAEKPAESRDREGGDDVTSVSGVAARLAAMAAQAAREATR